MRPVRIRLLLALVIMLVSAPFVRASYRQNWGRPFDPYRASAVRAGMPDWPIRGNRTNHRAWMHDHLYCCSVHERSRVLYAAETPYGSAALVMRPAPQGIPWPILTGHIGDGSVWGDDVRIPAQPEQVSVLARVPISPGDPFERGHFDVLLVVGRPGTTRVTWHIAGQPEWTGEVPLHDGAGYALVPDVEHPNDVIVTVERRGRVVDQNTVTTFGPSMEAPAPLVPLPESLRAVAGERADALAFRHCLVTAYDELPGLIRRPPPEMTYEETYRVHQHILVDHIRELARHPAIRTAGAAGVQAALRDPRSPVAIAVTTRCARAPGWRPQLVLAP